MELEGDGTSHPGPPGPRTTQGARATLRSTGPLYTPTQSSVPPAAARLPNPSLKVPGTPEEALQIRTIFTRYSLLYIYDLIVNPKDYNQGETRVLYFIPFSWILEVLKLY